MSEVSDDARKWTLRGAHVEYTVAVPEHGRWLELVAWGPHGVSEGPSPVEYAGPVPFLTAGDATPIEYATDAARPFTGADLVLETAAGDRRVSFSYVDADGDAGLLALTFADPVTGLRAVLHYQVPPGTVAPGSATSGDSGPRSSNSTTSTLSMAGSPSAARRVCPGMRTSPGSRSGTRPSQRARPGVWRWTGPVPGRSPRSGTPAA